MPLDEILIVRENIDRYKAYRKNKKGLERVCRGVYKREDVDREVFFTRYGLRIANHLFPSASLSYATAWLRKPAMGRVFVSGQYQYQRQLFDGSDRFVIVQSIGILAPGNPRLHTLEKFVDPFGSFEMLCDTPELTLLNMMTPTKRHVEKHLKTEDQDALIAALLSKHKSKGNIATALEEIAGEADRINEFRRVVNMLYAPPKAVSQSA